ncbi:MAG: hypothetical protein ACK2TX_10145 [Anaerolineales bacterium]
MKGKKSLAEQIGAQLRDELLNREIFDFSTPVPGTGNPNHTLV